MEVTYRVHHCTFHWRSLGRCEDISDTSYENAKTGRVGEGKKENESPAGRLRKYEVPLKNREIKLEEGQLKNLTTTKLFDKMDRRERYPALKIFAHKSVNP